MLCSCSYLYWGTIFSASSTKVSQRRKSRSGVEAYERATLMSVVEPTCRLICFLFVIVSTTLVCKKETRICLLLRGVGVRAGVGAVSWRAWLNFGSVLQFNSGSEQSRILGCLTNWLVKLGLKFYRHLFYLKYLPNIFHISLHCYLFCKFYRLMENLFVRGRWDMDFWISGGMPDNNIILDHNSLTIIFMQYKTF